MHSESPGESTIEPTSSDSMSGLDPADSRQPVIDNGASATSAGVSTSPSTANTQENHSISHRTATSSGDEAPLSFSSPDASPPPIDSTASPSLHHPASHGQESILQPSTTSTSMPSMSSRPALMRAGTDPSSRPTPPLQHHQHHQAEAGPSSRTSRPRAVRYADPDRHWLSEDEGEMHSNDVTARNRNRQQGSSSHQGGGGGHDTDDSGGKDTDGDKDQALLARQTTETQSHPINHKPANIRSDLSMLGLAKDYTSLLPRLATITPNLLKSLQCPSCTNLLRDPTTLSCGHSVCLGCSAPDASPIQIQQAAVASAISSTMAEVLSPRQQSRLQLDTNTEEQNSDRQASGATAAASPEIPQQSSPTPKAKKLFNDVSCPVTTCRKTTKASELSKYGIRTDFVLHKLTSLLRAHIPSISEGFSLSDQIVSQSTREGSEELQNALEELESTPSSSPDEAPKDEDGAKRIMGRHRQWKASKRNKSSVRSSGRTSPTIPILVSDVLSELECQVCVTLIYEPITTPCGHTFCKRCLFRSLDHSTRCPLCRSDLPGFNFFVTAPFNFTISNLLLTTFPLLYEDRKIAYEAEQRDTGLDTPIFVCMVAFPFMPTNLHIYEPRYRLMMRRAMDGNKRFGMVLPSRSNDGISQYGTMLEIEDIHVFDDGRSLVQTKGVHRFKILETGTLDGYSVGRVERIEDIRDEEEAELERPALARSAEQARQPTPTSGAASPSGRRSRAPSIVRRLSRPISPPAAPAQTPPGPETQDTSELTNKELIDVCKSFVEALRTGSTPWLRQRLNDTMPPMPDDPREFTWWMAMLMPIDDHEKARLLQITSYRLRLRLLVFWIQQMQHSWWFSRGCTIA